MDADHRDKGFGRAIFCHLARVALAAGCDRMQWSVKDDNNPALRFYRRLNAEAISGYTAMRLSGDGLAALAHAHEDSP